MKKNLLRLFYVLFTASHPLRLIRFSPCSKAGINEAFEAHQGPVTGIDCHQVQGRLDFSHLFLSSSFDWTIKLWSLKVCSSFSLDVSFTNIYKSGWFFVILVGGDICVLLSVFPSLDVERMMPGQIATHDTNQAVSHFKILGSKKWHLPKHL